MKKVSVIILILLVFQISTVYAYTITAVDDELFCFKESKFEKDSHRYKSIFEVSEKEGTITAIEDTDLNSGVSDADNRVFKIAVTPELQPVAHKKTLKAIYINEKTGGIEVITFCEDAPFYGQKYRINILICLRGNTFQIRNFNEAKSVVI